MRIGHPKVAGKRASRPAKSPRVFGHPPGRAKTPFRVGPYTRVPTQDQQTIPLQTRTMREYATRRGWRIALEVKEIGSGASQRERRQKLLEAGRREIDVVLVWRLDRWGRSVTDLLATLHADQVRKLFYRAGINKAESARRVRIGRSSVRRSLAEKSESGRGKLRRKFPMTKCPLFV